MPGAQLTGIFLKFKLANFSASPASAGVPAHAELPVIHRTTGNPRAGEET